MRVRNSIREEDLGSNKLNISMRYGAAMDMKMGGYNRKGAFIFS